MRPALSSRFVDKAEAALVAAIEVYNKPAFAYREETFALLMINAWELLLKAKLLKERVSGILCVGHTMTMPRSMYATQEEATGERAGF